MRFHLCPWLNIPYHILYAQHSTHNTFCGRYRRASAFINHWFLFLATLKMTMHNQNEMEKERKPLFTKKLHSYVVYYSISGECGTFVFIHSYMKYNKCCIFHMNCNSSTRASFYNAHLYNKQIKRTVTTSKNHFGLFFSVPLKLLAFKICQNPNVDRNVIFIEYSCCEIRKPLYISSTLIWVMLCEVSFNLNSIIKKCVTWLLGGTQEGEKKSSRLEFTQSTKNR